MAAAGKQRVAAVQPVLGACPGRERPGLGAYIDTLGEHLSTEAMGSGGKRGRRGGALRPPLGTSPAERNGQPGKGRPAEPRMQASVRGATGAACRHRGGGQRRDCGTLTNDGSGNISHDTRPPSTRMPPPRFRTYSVTDSTAWEDG